MVRMWLQGGENPAEPQWRGSIAEIGSGVRVYVTGTRDIADFIATRIAEREPR